MMALPFTTWSASTRRTTGPTEKTTGTAITTISAGTAAGRASTCSAGIRRLRLRRLKTFTVLLLFSQGVPMICAGDEFGRSQNGNNNAWCQDNQISWLDWSLLETNKGFHRFFRECIALRKKHALFRRKEFFPPAAPGDASSTENMTPEIAWQYLTPGVQNWSPDCQGLAFLLRASDDDKESSDFFVMLNGNRDKNLYFIAPQPQKKGRAWYRIIDTSAVSPDDASPLEAAIPQSTRNRIRVPPFGCVVLQSDY